MSPANDRRKLRSVPAGPSPESPTPGQALAGARASAGAREESTRPRRQAARAARSAARHADAAEAAKTGAEAFKSGLDHLLSRLKNLARADPARAEKWRRDLGAQLHEIARQIPTGKGDSR